MIYTLSLGLFLPLISFLVLLFSSFRIKRLLTGIIACSSVFISFLCFVHILYIYTSTAMQPTSFILFNWIPIQGLATNFSLHIDPLSILMALIITGVGFLIHVYSNGYMEHDPDFARYFACLNFFIFAILLLVLASDILVLFIGWEGVGLASYLLIGFWYEKPVATDAAIKAFVVNRVGDLGLLLGILLTFYLFGTSNIVEVSQRATQQFPVGAPIITILTLLYFIGAVGKSAQLPLHTWLPDAMAGPTPVSALIHAATMVTAGVYLVVRLHEVFLLAPITMEVVGVIGALTALYAALSAIGQTDLKKVLAYSTVSQLGLMFVACGAGAFYAAMFHLTAHAFIKALLFLSAGDVLHMVHDMTDMEQMGGFSKKLPKTHWLFLIGALALSGIPPFAAFFSKDFILEEEYYLGLDVLFYISLVACICTGVYLMRAYYLTFLGTTRLNVKIYDTIKEAPRIMIIPLIVLSLLAMGGGFLGYGIDGLSMLEKFLTGAGLNDVIHNTGSFLHPESIGTIAGACLGVIITLFIYTRYYHSLGQTLQVLSKAFYVDEIYHALFVVPLERLSLFISHFIEPKIFDESITMTATTMQRTAGFLRQLQSGQIRSYVAWMLVGTVIVVVYFVL